MTGFSSSLLSHLELVASQQYQQVDCIGSFVYDLDALSSHLDTLVDQDVVKLWYAVKANPLSSVLQTIADKGINFDVASAGELEHVLTQRVNADRILNTGPAKSKQQLSLFLDKGVNTFVVESINQLNWLEQLSEEKGYCPDVLLRVQLQWPDGEKNPLGGNTLTPFGLGCHEWSSIAAEDYQHINICGLHIFQWGNMLSNEKMKSLWSQMVEPLMQLAKQVGFTVKVLDLGGGFGVDYLGQGTTICWRTALDDLATIKAQAGVEEIWLELGRFAVAECGYYLTSVVDKKSNFNEQQLVLAAGINHIIRPAITEQPFPCHLLRQSDNSLQDFHVHGPLCTSLDKLGVLPLPEDTTIGDSLVFSYCGAYGFTESMPFFLCHQVANEYVISGDVLTEVRKAEPATWYLR